MLASSHEYSHATGPDVERHLSSLIARLTTGQKIAMLGVDYLKAHGMPEVGLPPLQIADGPVGVTKSIAFEERTLGATSFPATIGLAASFNEALAYRYGEGVGRDARARGVHIMLGPGVNIYRSPLCSRNFEYAGEDPLLAGKTAAAWVRGCQDQRVGVTVKHYAANFQEYDRYFVSSDVSERALREIYLEAFRIAVQEGGASGIMTAYNKLNGVYCSEHPHLIQEILKDEWGFDGYVMSDAVSTHNAVAAVVAGLDLELPVPEVFNEHNLLPALLDGRVSERNINDKVRRLLRVAYCFGWLEHEQLDSSIKIEDEQNVTVALDVAREAVVLLRNENSFLPFKSDRVKKLAVIGPTADPAVTGGGGSSYVRPWRETSILKGIEAEAQAAGVEVLYAKGCDPFRHQHVQQTSSYTTTDGKPGVYAEYFNDRDFRGEPVVSRVEPDLILIWMREPPAPGVSKDSFAARYTGRIHPEKSGEHVFTIWGGDGEYRVLVAGTPVFDTWGKGHSGAVQSSIELEGDRDYDLLLEYRPTWRYNWVRFGFEHVDNMWPDHERALEIAREADAVIFCGGHTRWTESENFDRDFAMPPVARRLLEEVTEASDNVGVVLTGGSNIEMASWIDRTKALLHAWYPGQEGGTAIAQILFGTVSPSGKLPITIEADPSERSSAGSYHDVDGDKHVFLNDGVFAGYRYVDAYGKEPLFPFGFGLSYTTFAYSSLELSADSIRDETFTDGRTLEVSFEIENTGQVEGAEAAQIYVADLEASVPRPPKELKGYAKLTLAPGEKKRANVVLDKQAFSFFDPVTERWTAEPGTFEILIGASSKDIRLRARVELLG